MTTLIGLGVVAMIGAILAVIAMDLNEKKCELEEQFEEVIQFNKEMEELLKSVDLMDLVKIEA